MSILKKVTAAILATGIVFTMNAQAGDLTIKNKTSFSSTSFINGKVCSSTVLGRDGVTLPGQEKTLKENQLRLACAGHLLNCQADVYMSDNCTGDIVTSVVFSVKQGVISVSPPKTGFSVTWRPFYIEIAEAVNNQ